MGVLGFSELLQHPFLFPDLYDAGLPYEGASAGPVSEPLYELVYLVRDPYGERNGYVFALRSHG